MMRIITIGDLIDLYFKAKQRGGDFILSKISFKGLSRTKSAFNESSVESSNWWVIPKVKQRWNKLITGDSQINYKQYLMRDFLKDKSELRLISLGSGSCSNELELAEYPNFKEIICVDIVENSLLEAEKTAQKRNLRNIKFICSNVNNYNIRENYFDIVLFNSSSIILNVAASLTFPLNILLALGNPFPSNIRPNVTSGASLRFSLE